jgi:protein SCO1
MNEPTDQPRINPWTIWVPIIFIVLGVVVYYNYVTLQALRTDKDRPAFLTQIRKDLDLVERSGKAVKFSELDGKVILGAHFYSTCPSGCSVLVEEMKAIYDELGPKHPALHFISFAIDPEDTPQRMKEAAEGHEITGENWWFVNGNQDAMRTWLNFVVKFIALKEKPVEKRTSPVDKYEHDMRLVLIDHRSHVRGMYEVMNPDPEFRAIHKEKLKKDLAYVLAEQAAEVKKLPQPQ